MQCEVMVRNKGLVISLLAFVVIIAGAGVDIFLPSLPFIGRAFGVAVQKTQLIVVLYVASYGFFQIFAGIVIDAFDHKKVLLFSLLLFSIATLLMPVSYIFNYGINVFLGIRILQAVFAAGIGVGVRVLLTDYFSGSSLVKYASYITSSWSVGPILAPCAGGYLQHLLGWRASFYFLSAYSFIVLVVAFFYLPDVKHVSCQFNIQRIFSNYIKVFKNKAIICGAVSCGLAYGFIVMYNVAGPFLVEKILGYSPVFYGHMALFFGLSWLLGSVILQKIATRSNVEVIMYLVLMAGVIISIVMLILALNNHFNLWSVLIPPLLLFVIGAMLFAYCYGRCLSIFLEAKGVSSAALGAIYCMVAALASAVGSSFKSTSLIPLASGYLVVIMVAVFVFFLMQRFVKQCR